MKYTKIDRDSVKTQKITFVGDKVMLRSIIKSRILIITQFPLIAHKTTIIKPSVNLQQINIYRKMSTGTDDYLERAERAVPELNNTLYKGQNGRIGVVGGSFEYTGAPYFASITSLKVGADAVHVFCCKDAAIPIKSYSPELMVHPVLDDENAIELIQAWLERLHVLIIGPGLGRDPKILATVAKLLGVCRELKKPLVIDADGLFLVAQDITIIANYPGVIITPNKVEFERIFGKDGVDMDAKFKAIGENFTVLEKGYSDKVYNSDKPHDYLQITGGGGRRCSGQGDILAGTTAIFYFWAMQAGDPEPAKVACYGASYLVKKLNPKTFKIKGRSMVASDMIENIHVVFEEYFEKKERN